MAQVIADRRDVDFVLFEQLAVEMLSDHERYADFNRKTIDMIVSEARNLAVKEICPPRKRQGIRVAPSTDGKVTVPDCYHRAYEMFLEGEWLAMPEDPGLWGGQGMPRTVAMAAGDYFNWLANYGFMMYAGPDPRRSRCWWRPFGRTRH
jgi:hypothetical protein